MTTSDHTENSTLEPQPFSVVDHYMIIRQLGRGGSGAVYLARDTKLGRKVALKLINPSTLGLTGSIKRFLFEAKVTAQFSHPHIVTVYGVGQFNDSPYVALEYIEGLSLRERIDNERPGVRESIRIGLAIAEALEEAHKHQILHRDLKPENVMLPLDGRVRVVDFGLAKAVKGIEADPVDTVDMDSVTKGTTKSTGGLMMTGGQGIVGTPRYMAPEQWLENECTPATDVWALGLIMYELLSGDQLHDEETVIAICARVCSQEKILPMKVKGVPEELASLVAGCVDKEPSNRPSTRQIVQLFNRLLHRDRGIPAGEESPFRGLFPFTERHANLFFGRDTEIGGFIERLREEPLLPVVGPSGVGKSSFVQAGVIPRLKEQGRWVVLKFRPGKNPFRSLASRLLYGDSEAISTDDSGLELKEAGRQATFGDLGEKGLAEQIMESPSRLSLFLNQIAKEDNSRVLLFVDQLEELYTLVENQEERRLFMAAIYEAADDPEGPVRAVLTLRDDFMIQLADTAEARQALGYVTVLRSPGPESLKEILVDPLLRTGYSYEDPTLVDRMVQAVKGEPASLPLIQFVCSQLWEKRDRKTRVITKEAYRELGGVEGALARHADGLLAKMLPKQVSLARQILLRLVTPKNTRQILTRGNLLEGLGSEAEEVLAILGEERIITAQKSRSTDKSDHELELAHESLIRDWEKLRLWVEESREELVFLDELVHAADLWEKRGRRREEVWRGVALQEALGRAERCSSIPKNAQLFLDTARQRETSKNREKRLLVLAVIFLLAIIIMWFSGKEQDAIVALEKAGDSLRLAEQRLEKTETRLRKIELKAAGTAPISFHQPDAGPDGG